MAKSKAEFGDSLANLLANALNKKDKDQTIAFFLDNENGDVGSTISGWISTGSTALDLAISNRANGGAPLGRILSIDGLEQSGKSLLSAHLLASTQKQGGIAVFIDTENAFSREFFEAIGIDLKKMVYIQHDTVEDIFQSIEDIIETIRTSNKDRIVTIVVDSVAGASTKSELAGDFEKTGYATDKAILMSKGLRKITSMIGKQKICLVFTNQLRTNIGAMAFQDPYVSASGGKALSFHASVRIRLKNVGKLKAMRENKKEVVVGYQTKAHIVKNRVGPPLREAIYNIYFESGIDDVTSFFNLAVEYGIIEQGGAWYSYTDPDTKEPIKFQQKVFKEKFYDVKELKDKIYKQICDAYIMKYKPKESVEVLDTQAAEEGEN